MAVHFKYEVSTIIVFDKVYLLMIIRLAHYGNFLFKQNFTLYVQFYITAIKIERINAKIVFNQ